MTEQGLPAHASVVVIGGGVMGCAEVTSCDVMGRESCGAPKMAAVSMCASPCACVTRRRPPLRVAVTVPEGATTGKWAADEKKRSPQFDVSGLIG